MPDQNAARSTPTRRCVWLSEDQAKCNPALYEVWLAAPADPVGLAATAIRHTIGHARTPDDIANVVIAALGGFPLETT